MDTKSSREESGDSRESEEPMSLAKAVGSMAFTFLKVMVLERFWGLGSARVNRTAEWSEM